MGGLVYMLTFGEDKHGWQPSRGWGLKGHRGDESLAEGRTHYGTQNGAEQRTPI